MSSPDISHNRDDYMTVLLSTVTLPVSFVSSSVFSPLPGIKPHFSTSMQYVVSCAMPVGDGTPAMCVHDAE